MSIILGLKKGSDQIDRDEIKKIASTLVDLGYVRRILINEEEATVQTFTREENEILPAHIIDKITRETKK